MDNDKEPTGDVTPEEAAQAMAATVAEMKDLQGKANKLWDTSSKWEAREAAREAQIQKEYESVQTHRVNLEKLHAESNKVYAAEVESFKAHREWVQKQDEVRMGLIQREVVALETIAAALTNANKK